MDLVFFKSDLNHFGFVHLILSYENAIVERCIVGAYY